MPLMLLRRWNVSLQSANRYRWHCHPPVLMVPDVLTPKECLRLIEVYETRGKAFVQPGPGIDYIGTDYKMRIPEYGLVYAGRVGSGINNAELERLWRRLQPLATDRMPLDVAPPRGSRFGSPLVLSRVHWVQPELVAEVKFLTWTDDNLLRQVVYEGLREDKRAGEVRRGGVN